MQVLAEVTNYPTHEHDCASLIRLGDCVANAVALAPITPGAKHSVQLR